MTTILTTTRTRDGWLHSWPILPLPPENCCLFASTVMDDACEVMNALHAGGFVPHVGKSKSVEVAAAVSLRWTVFLDGDEDEVRAARKYLREWRNGN